MTISLINSGRSEKYRGQKTSMCSLRIQQDVKNQLTTVAAKQRRTLSALIKKILQEYLDSCNDNSEPAVFPEERRRQPRKKIVIPARWRVKDGQSLVEHDVIVKNISSGGAYTEYINGQSFHLLKNLLFSSLGLVVRMPGFHESVELDCQVQRIHITKQSVGIGLRFTNIQTE